MASDGMTDLEVDWQAQVMGEVVGEEDVGRAILQELRVLNALVFEALGEWLARHPLPPAPQPSPSSLPPDLPGRQVFEAAGVRDLDQVPKSGEQLERMGLDVPTISRLLIWRAQNGSL